jgi:hypothetical protein
VMGSLKRAVETMQGNSKQHVTAVDEDAMVYIIDMLKSVKCTGHEAKLFLAADAADADSVKEVKDVHDRRLYTQQVLDLTKVEEQPPSHVQAVPNEDDLYSALALTGAMHISRAAACTLPRPKTSRGRAPVMDPSIANGNSSEAVQVQAKRQKVDAGSSTASGSKGALNYIPLRNGHLMVYNCSLFPSDATADGTANCAASGAACTTTATTTTTAVTPETSPDLGAASSIKRCCGSGVSHKSSRSNHTTATGVKVKDLGRGGPNDDDDNLTSDEISGDDDDDETSGDDDEDTSSISSRSSSSSSSSSDDDDSSSSSADDGDDDSQRQQQHQEQSHWQQHGNSCRQM